jgi:octopine/nopaline transport system permease protein
MIDTPFLLETLRFVASGVPTTILLTVIIVILSLPLAIGLALARLSPNPVVAGIATGYVAVMRAVPLLVLLFLFYYGLGQFAAVRTSFLWPMFREPLWCAVLVLTLNAAAYASEVVRGGLLSVPRGDLEAAKAFGLSGWLLARRVVAPLAVRQALPAYSSEIILTLKATSLASVITLTELTSRATELNDNAFRPFEIFIVAGAIYMVLNVLIAESVRLAERRLFPERRPS